MRCSDPLGSSIQHSLDICGKRTPHGSCVRCACIRGQSAAMIRRSFGPGSLGPCSASSRAMARRPCRSQRSQATSSIVSPVVASPATCVMARSIAGDVVQRHSPGAWRCAPSRRRASPHCWPTMHILPLNPRVNSSDLGRSRPRRNPADKIGRVATRSPGACMCRPVGPATHARR